MLGFKRTAVFRNNWAGVLSEPGGATEVTYCHLRFSSGMNDCSAVVGSRETKLILNVNIR